MRIGIYDPYLDDSGGGEKYMMTAAQYLSQDNDVTVFWDDKNDLEKVANRFSLDLEKIHLEKNIFTHATNLLKRLSVTRKYDALFILTDGSIPVVSSKKLLLHIQQPLSGIEKFSTKDILKLKRVTAVFYNSEFTKKFNSRIFKNRNNFVLYPPVKIVEKKIKKENIIIHVGRFRYIDTLNSDYKKQQLMIDVFKKMIDSGQKNWKFILAISTNDDNSPNFKKLAESSKGYPVEFLVNKGNSDLWNVYNKAKIYWHASGFGEDLESHPEYAEHFGISTVEAMGAGAVPVVINAGGQKEIVVNEENGLLWNTLDEFVECTKRLINDVELWEKLSVGAKIRSKDFSYEKFCNGLDKLLSI